MSLVKGINSNVSVSEADEYFSTRVDSEAWSEANTAQKSSALVTATGLLDELSWTGVAASATQSLAFPRKGQYLDPRLGMLVTLDGVTLPERVAKTTYELALHLVNNEGLTNETGGVDSIKLGTIELKNIDSISLIPAGIKKFVRPLLTNTSSMWWRAN